MSGVSFLEISSQRQYSTAVFIEFLKSLQIEVDASLASEFSFALLDRDYQFVLVDINQSYQVYSQLSVHTSEVRSTQAIDSFLKVDGKWYPRLFIADALRELLVEKIKHIDQRFAGYVIGDGVMARIAAASLVFIGLVTVLFCSAGCTGNNSFIAAGTSQKETVPSGCIHLCGHQQQIRS